jgi:nucleotide-binding universal stress UspA family protein
MSYKTILVHADTSIHAPARVRLAAALARAEGAHLIGAAMTGLARISRTVVADSTTELTRTIPSGYEDAVKEHARQALEQFTALAQEAGVMSHEALLVDDDVEGGLVALSRFADLVVLSQSDPAHDVAGVVRDLPEYVVLNGARPVLIVPYAGQYANLDGKALAAWDGSIVASRALGNALPLLRRAAAVTIAQFDTAEPGELETQAPHLVQWLARHGIKAGIHEQHTDIHEGDTLLSLAANLQSDLIVMGGYGHTRFRELLLGGVTRTVLASMTVPVLMSH